MSIFNLILIIFFLLKISYSLPLCKEKENNCEKCNPIINLCVKCMSDNYFPDMNGGCEPKCILGKNFCNLCDEDQKLCISCEEGLYPDKIGACSYTNNCKTSYKGKCLTCIDEFILVEDTGFCKSVNMEDLKNCLSISDKNGTCLECIEGYFLNEGDLKCTDTEFCYESTFGVCKSCINEYYLDKRRNKCVKSEIINCKQTIDGINCDECNDNYYLTDNLQCTETNMCSQAKDGKCIKCMENYILSGNEVCTQEQNCQTADKDTGVCSVCKTRYYLDIKSKKCKSNQDNEELYFCRKADITCLECEAGYYLGEDLRCSSTQNCVESEKGKCLGCKNNLYLDEDRKCTIIEHCKHSSDNPEEHPCRECLDNYFFDITNQKCAKVENDTYANCLKGHYFGVKCIFCRENYYNNRSEGLCYENTDENSEFYKCKSTDAFGDHCEECENGYFNSRGNRRCSKIETCLNADKGKCIECEEGYCLDVKNNDCIDNEFLEDINNKFYIACNRTNKEGTRCERCLDGYELGEEGYCIDVSHCEIKEDEECKKCVTEYFNHGGVHYYCYNSVFGCIKFFSKGCLKCENLADLYECTECDEGFELNEYGYCKEIN